MSAGGRSIIIWGGTRSGEAGKRGSGKAGKQGSRRPVTTLRSVDADYLLRVLPLEPGLRVRLQEFRLGRAPLLNADRAELRDLVGERLAAVGFDADGRPTPEGMRLEELIDLLFTSLS
jgi:hypothetical protein